MSFGVRVKIDGLEQLFARLAGIKKSLRTRILRKAVDKASKPILARAKALVPRDTGLLRKSLGRRVKTYGKTGVAVAVIGPRVGFRKQRAEQGKKKLVKAGSGAGRVMNPVKYAHLVEKGTAHSAARPFLRPALVALKDQARQIMAEVILAELGKAGP